MRILLSGPIGIRNYFSGWLIIQQVELLTWSCYEWFLFLWQTSWFPHVRKTFLRTIYHTCLSHVLHLFSMITPRLPTPVCVVAKLEAVNRRYINGWSRCWCGALVWSCWREYRELDRLSNGFEQQRVGSETGLLFSQCSPIFCSAPEHAVMQRRSFVSV